MKEHGDKRQSPIVERTEATALKETDLAPSEPVTVIVSKSGWIRSAKGHDVDAANMNYRSGDAYLAHAQGKSNEKVYLRITPVAAIASMPIPYPLRGGKASRSQVC